MYVIKSYRSIVDAYIRFHRFCLILLSYNNRDGQDHLLFCGYMLILKCWWMYKILSHCITILVWFFFHFEFFHLKQYLVKEHLISLYCNDADQLFSQSAIQEILGNIAFEVCSCFNILIYIKKWCVNLLLLYILLYIL